MKDRRKISIKEAISQVEEERTWTCEWCDKMVDDGETFCRQCKMYEEDLAAGVFDEPTRTWDQELGPFNEPEICDANLHDEASSCWDDFSS